MAAERPANPAKAAATPPRAAGGPGQVPPPGDTPRPRRAITGKAELATDDGLLAVGVRDGHGLKVGDVVEVLVDGSVAGGGKVVEAAPFRIVLRLDDGPGSGGIGEREVVLRRRQ